MSVPLDRLYDHLYNICDRDIIIYRWLPHGSKKLNDLKLLMAQSGKKLQITPAAIMHDQEPLKYDLWTREDYCSRWEGEIIARNFDKTVLLSQEVLEFIAEMGLRGALVPSSNFYDRVLLFHSECNSNQVQIYQEHGYEPVYYWSHALIARDWFRYAQVDPCLEYSPNLFSKDFLIYNRAWTGTREYRLKFVELLLNAKIESHCQTTFSTIDDNTHYLDHRFENSNFQISRRDIEHFLPTNTHSSTASADYNNADYAAAGIEVVLETLFDDYRHHLTEKALRPVATGKPFILVATPGSLQYLRSYGFKTFNGLINEDYDNVQDPVDRLNAVVLEMQRISNLSSDDKIELWNKLHEIAEFNKQRFFSTEFIDLVQQELKENLDHALSILDKNCTGYYWRSAPHPRLMRSQNETDQIDQQLAEFLANPKTLSGVRVSKA